MSAGNRCILFQAFVTKQWVGGTAYNYDQCYSSFSSPRNIIEQHSYDYFNYHASSVKNPNSEKNPGKGYYSFLHTYGFYSGQIVPPATVWWMIDLKEEIILRKVIVVVMVQIDVFQKVKVRFGNSFGYQMNTEIPYSAIPQERTPLIVDVHFIIKGRYLSLESNTGRYLAFGPVLIFKRE